MASAVALLPKVRNAWRLSQKPLDYWCRDPHTHTLTYSGTLVHRQEHSVHTAPAYLRSATCHKQKMELLFTRVLMLECRTNLFLF